MIYSSKPWLLPAAFLLFLILSLPSFAIPDNGLGKTPYMGWSSWSLEATKYPGYGGMNWVTAAHLEAQSDALHKTLQAHGYTYVNIDSGWMGGYDANGRPIPDSKKFPLGIAGVAAHVHQNGQKLGIYWIPGINDDLYKLNPPILGTTQHIQDIVFVPQKPANGWGGGWKIDYSKPGAQAYINSIAAQFAEWGIDFFKLDGVTPGSDHTDLKIDARPDVEAWATALKLAGRPIWLELSWGLDRRYANEWRKYANGRRITTDVETYGPTLTGWDQISWRFEAARDWAKEAGPDKGWNDLDSVDVGSGLMDGLNRAERQTMMTLWAVACAPLYSGDDLTQLDPYGLELLTNEEVIAVDQAGYPAAPVYAVGNTQIWRTRNADGSVTAALFNLGGKDSAKVTATWHDLGLIGPAHVRDLWSHRDLGAFDGSFHATLAPHGSLLIRLTGSVPAINATVTVDPNIRYQTWQGWGTSLAWWAKVVGGFPEPARHDYIEKAFDPVKGLGLNIVRYNIGGGENPLYQTKPLLSFRCAVPGYEPSPGVWDWTADANQRWVLQESIKKGANQLEAFSNSPPWWATVSGSVTGNKGGADNLDPKFDGAFAKYLTTVVQHFHDSWGITFRDLEPLNEPSGGWSYGGTASNQEGCHVDRPHQNAVVGVVGAALAHTSTGGVTGTASDEPSIGDADKTFGFYDAASLASLTKINTHSYGGGDRTQLCNSALSSGKDLWLSEYGDGDGSGLQMSRQILTDIQGLHPTAWVYWQVVDSAGGWGFLKNPLSDETTTAYTFNKKYYVMGQYSKFLRPGSRFLAITDPNSLAAYDPKVGRLVLVSTNSGDEETRVAYDLSSFKRLSRSATAYRTSPTEDLASLLPLALSNGQFSAVLPAHSVTTFLVPCALDKNSSGLDYRDSFTLVSQSAGLAVDTAQASADNAASIVQSASTPGPSRCWRFLGLGLGDYKVINAGSGLALDVSQSSVAPGGVLIQYTDNGGDNQVWHLTRLADGAYTLTNRHSGLALAASEKTEGTRLTQQTSDGSASQEWRLVKVP